MAESSPQRLVTSATWLSRAVSALAVFIGVVSLAAWAFGGETPYVVLAFVLAGVSLAFLGEEWVRPPLRRLGRGLAWVVALVGLVQLADGLLGGNVGVGHTAFGSLNFVLIGGALLLSDAAHRRAEQALLQERYLLRALMDNVPDSIYFKDRDSRFIRISKFQAARFGLSDPAQAVGKSDFDFFNPDHSRPAYEDEQEIIRSGQPMVAKEEHEIWPDGGERWASSTKMPLTDERGQTVGTFGISRDITDRKRAVEALRKTEERLRLLLESTDEGVYGVDLQGRCTFINSAAAARLGYRAEEVVGQDMHALIHHSRPDGAPYRAEESPILRSMRTGRGNRVDREVFWRRDRTSFPTEYSCNPIRTESGEIQGAVVAFTDITERNRLRQMVVQSEKLASIGLLSAGIAHEINNPLAFVGNNLVVLEREFQSLMAFADACEEERGGPAIADTGAARRLQTLAEECDLPYLRANLGRLLGRTREGVQRVARIVHSLRNLARKDRPELEDVSLQELVGMSVEIIRGRLSRSGTEVELDLEQVPRLRCVRGHLGQVLLNLLTNALHAVETAGHAAGGRIRIASRYEGDVVVLEVIDNGCGMPAQDLDKIFDPFFTTKPVGEGTGLGLAIAHGLITGHGGRIEVESQPEQGSCFRIILPRDPERAGLS